MGVLSRTRDRLRPVPEIVPSPNIWQWPDVYEIENRAQDVGAEVWGALALAFDWSGRDVLDVGCGDGFHLPRFAGTARHVLGVEPYEPLVHRARSRAAGLSNVDVQVGSAQRLPVPDASRDLVHARTAYFFGPGCQPGLREVDRVLRPGGMLAIVDLDATVTPYGGWMRADLPQYQPARIDAFFERAGFSCQRVRTLWRFADRSSLEAVLKIEFSERVAARAIQEVSGLSFPVGYRVLLRRKPAGLIMR